MSLETGEHSGVGRTCHLSKAGPITRRRWSRRKIKGLVIIGILPLGSSAAGPSAMPRLPESRTRSPDTRVRVVNGGVRCAAAGFAPVAKTVPLGEQKELDPPNEA